MSDVEKAKDSIRLAARNPYKGHDVQLADAIEALIDAKLRERKAPIMTYCMDRYKSNGPEPDCDCVGYCKKILP